MERGAQTRQGEKKKKNETKEADIKRTRRSDESERGIGDRDPINLQPGVNHMSLGLILFKNSTKIITPILISALTAANIPSS